MSLFSGQAFTFQGGYPTASTIERAYDDADLVRAISMYRFFWPTVSFEATWRANLQGGVVPNSTYPLLNGTPLQLVFTPNSDTPYAGVSLDLSDGPMVVELPPGPLMGTVNDLNQLWVSDVGLPGPAKAEGGRHLILPPDYGEEIPEGYYVGRSTTNRVLMLVRALPRGKDMEAAIDLIKTVKAYPLGSDPEASHTNWVDLTERVGLDFTPVRWETGLEYWRVLHEILQADVLSPDYAYQYGELAELGITKGGTFDPDDRMKIILELASVMGHAQLAVQSFADRREERVVWPGTQWEWAVLQPNSGTFDAGDYIDLHAREKWFYQAQVESPAMFAREPGAGSLYWLGLRDSMGLYLDGAHTYTLEVPQPVPASLFWSVTVYDARTRSEILTDQNKAALRSLFELADLEGEDAATLHFGPRPPAGAGAADRWIQTKPGTGWFVYFRIYGPTEEAFSGDWRLPDFELVG